MKRSKTTYTQPTSCSQSFGLHPGDNPREMTLSPRSQNTTFTQANASWGHHAPARATCPRDSLCPKRTRNMFLQNDKEISSLITLLHSNKFSGEIDPKHHSQYMKEPAAPEASKRKPRRLGECHHRSDGHLLKVKV